MDFSIRLPRECAFPWYFLSSRQECFNNNNRGKKNRKRIRTGGLNCCRHNLLWFKGALWILVQTQTNQLRAIFPLLLDVLRRYLHKCNHAVRLLTFTQLIYASSLLLMDKHETSSANSFCSLQLIKCQKI